MPTPTPLLPFTRERLLALLDDVLACPDAVCLERVRLAITGAPAHDVHARMVHHLIATPAREVGVPDAPRGPRE